MNTIAKKQHKVTQYICNNLIFLLQKLEEC